jgi:hypothetical protein
MNENSFLIDFKKFHAIWNVNGAAVDALVEIRGKKHLS